MLCLNLISCPWTEGFWSLLVQFGHLHIPSRYSLAWDSSASRELYKRHSSCLQGPDCLQNQKLSVGIFSSSGIVWICLSCFTDSWTNSGAWVTFKSVAVWCLISKSRDNSPHFLILKFHVLLSDCLLSWWWWKKLSYSLLSLEESACGFPFRSWLLTAQGSSKCYWSCFIQHEAWPLSGNGIFSISVTNTRGGISCICVILDEWWIGSKEWSVYLHSFVKNISSSGYQIMADLSDSASFVRFTGSGKRLGKATDQ